MSERENRDSGHGERNRHRRPNSGKYPNKKYGDRKGPQRSGSSGERREGGHSRGGTSRYRDGKSSNNEQPRTPHIEEPAVDPAIQPSDLPKESRGPLLAFKKEKAETVARHLVQIFHHLQEDPNAAKPHVDFLLKIASRIDVVREAAGLTYYATGEYAQALKEFRTHKRMTNATEYLAHIVDCERAVGNTDKALRLFAEYSELELPLPVELELALVASGIRLDAGELDFALQVLRNPRFKNLPAPLRPRHAEAIAAVFSADGQEERAQELLARFGLSDADLAQAEAEAAQNSSDVPEEEPDSPVTILSDEN